VAQLQRLLTHSGRRVDRMRDDDDDESIKGLARRICTTAIGASALMVRRVGRTDRYQRGRRCSIVLYKYVLYVALFCRTAGSSRLISSPPQAADVAPDWLSTLVGILFATGGLEDSVVVVQAAEALGQHGRIATRIMPEVGVDVCRPAVCLSGVPDHPVLRTLI